VGDLITAILTDQTTRDQRAAKQLVAQQAEVAMPWANKEA